jgi:ATPase subunit of ABC transporter with duplicated ATPase domains
MQASIAMLIRQTAEVENNMSSIERLEWYAKSLPQEAPAIIKETAPPPTWPDQGAVAFRDVEIRYRPELPSVVRNFNLQIRGGEKVGVVGRTGAGECESVSAQRTKLTSDGWLHRQVNDHAGALPNPRDVQGSNRDRRRGHQQAWLDAIAREVGHHPAGTIAL